MIGFAYYGKAKSRRKATYGRRLHVLLAVHKIDVLGSTDASVFIPRRSSLRTPPLRKSLKKSGLPVAAVCKVQPVEQIAHELSESNLSTAASIELSSNNADHSFEKYGSMDGGKECEYVACRLAMPKEHARYTACSAALPLQKILSCPH
eukprot:6188060-Pleurochrysis_carterae.AAC.3